MGIDPTLLPLVFTLLNHEYLGSAWLTYFALTSDHVVTQAVTQ